METISRRSFIKHAGQVAALGLSGNKYSAATSSPIGQQQVELSQGWRIRPVSPQASLDAATLSEAEHGQGDAWLDAGAMPVMVHDVLLAHGKIETPWLPGQAENCRWVAEQDWMYAVTFANPWPERASRLHFQGLDTIVDVYLNGERVATHSDMYLPLEVNLGGRLRTQNTLVLHFHTVFDLSGAKPAPLRTWKGDPPQLVRRSDQNYSEYLGPKPYFSRVGVYDRVLLEAIDSAEMTEVVADAALDESLTQGMVRVDVAGASRESSLEVRLRLLRPDGRIIDEATSTAAVRDGSFAANVTMKVDHPDLWWPRGYGDQALYKAEITLLAKGRPLQVEKRTLGFRRITMAAHLSFVVNGVAVRLWGSDWVTPDWQTEVWDQARVEKLIAMAENANFNTLRVWGEVASPRDTFYELADAKGLLLWQDFTDLPLAPDENSRTVCRREAELFVKRLKHHPSILLWCGNNEGAQWASKDYDHDFKDHGPWPGLLAAEEVGAICKQLDPSRYYQPSTPYYGAFPNSPQGGDSHGYTHCWFVPGYDYLTFASEDTRIAAPTLPSLKRFMAPEDLWPAGYSTLLLKGNTCPYPKTWLKYTTNESWRKTGPVEQFYDATNPAEMVYRLGMADSLYYRDTIERQRRGREATDLTGHRRSGGYLAWKFADSWPQIFSAKVDYFLEPYHVYYALRRAFQPVLLSFEIGTYIYLWAVNDSPEPVSGTVKIQLLHLESNEIHREIIREVTVASGQSVVVVRLDQAGIASFRREHILTATLISKPGLELSRTSALADLERRIDFPDARLAVIEKNGALTITTDKFAKCVTLEGDSPGWFFEDNYFDLVPGEIKVVRILGEKSKGRISVKPWYSSQTTLLELHRLEHP